MMTNSLMKANSAAMGWTFIEAISGPQREEWIAAMNEEIESLEETDTWNLEPIPKGKTAVGCKWVYKVKRSREEEPDHYKARLVAKGFSQKYGIDYDEIFAPVIRGSTIRILLSIAGDRNYFVNHHDVKNAFLNGKLNEDIYMAQPPGHINTYHKDWAHQLNKSIYGLKQAARVWCETLNEVLTNCGFIQNADDACLYKHGSRTLTYLVVHVDDIIIASRSQNRMDEIIKALSRRFSITNLGDIKCYLGTEIRRDDQGEFLINQSNYIRKVLSRTRLNQAKPSGYPMDPKYEAHRVDSPANKSESYCRLIGALLYLSVNTRPDIATPVGLLGNTSRTPS